MCCPKQGSDEGLGVGRCHGASMGLPAKLIMGQGGLSAPWLQGDPCTGSRGRRSELRVESAEGTREATSPVCPALVLLWLVDLGLSGPSFYIQNQDLGSHVIFNLFLGLVLCF